MAHASGKNTQFYSTDRADTGWEEQSQGGHYRLEAVGEGKINKFYTEGPGRVRDVSHWEDGLAEIYGGCEKLWRGCTTENIDEAY